MAPPLTKVTKLIIIACVVSYFAGYVFENFHFVIAGASGQDFFGLVPKSVVHDFWLWQPITYLFLHGHPFHLLMNMLILWFFGSEIEMKMGERRFLFFFLLCGVGGAVANIAVSYLFFPARIATTVIGASGAVYGILAAYGLFFRDRYLLLLFIFPVKAMYFALIMFGLELAMGFQQKDLVAHFAHLGGLLAGGGYVYFKYFFHSGGGGKGRSRRDLEKEKLKRQFTLIVNESVDKSKEKENNGPFWN